MSRLPDPLAFLLTVGCRLVVLLVSSVGHKGATGMSDWTCKGPLQPTVRRCSPSTCSTLPVLHCRMLPVKHHTSDQPQRSFPCGKGGSWLCGVSGVSAPQHTRHFTVGSGRLQQNHGTERGRWEKGSKEVPPWRCGRSIDLLGARGQVLRPTGDSPSFRTHLGQIMRMWQRVSSGRNTGSRMDRGTCGDVVG